MERMMGKQMGVYGHDPRPVPLEEELANEWGKKMPTTIMPAVARTGDGEPPADSERDFESRYGFEDPLGR